jgi:hypothetical protein
LKAATNKLHSNLYVPVTSILFHFEIIINKCGTTAAIDAVVFCQCKLQLKAGAKI